MCLQHTYAFTWEQKICWGCSTNQLRGNKNAWVLSVGDLPQQSSSGPDKDGVYETGAL